MNRAIKNWVVWLLMIALPLQGFAAVERMSCSPDHHVALENVEHIQDAHSQHHHESGQLSSLDNQDGESLHHSPHKHAPSSYCGSCCIVAFALPVSIDSTVLSAREVTEVVAPIALVTRFIPDGPERPPRILLV